MRLLTLIGIALFSLTSCSLFHSGPQQAIVEHRRPSSEQASEVHLVLDIDWTIVRPLETPDLPEFKETGRVISLTKEDHYLLSEGVREILDFARENRWLKISFFSGGHRARNQKLLAQIYDSQGKSAKDHAYKVLSNEELSIVSQDKTLRFSHRHKKDLKKVINDLDKVIFVDDLKHFALDNGGLERTSWLGSTYHPWPEGMSTEKYHDYWLARGKKSEHLAPDSAAGFWTKRKLFLLLAAIEKEGPHAAEIHRRLSQIDLSRVHFEDDMLSGLSESPSYQQFIKKMGCPVPLL